MQVNNFFKVMFLNLPKNKLLRVVDYNIPITYRQNSSMMRAVNIKEYGALSVLKLREVTIPVPSNSEALVKVFAAGINPVDVYIREGAFMNLPSLPMILGKEVAGVIESVGPEVKKFKVGDRVTCCLPKDGGYAEYVTCDQSHIIPLSEKISFSQGASLYVAYFSAYRALVTKCKIKKGEFLLVHGASGAVGIAATQIAKAKGLKVVGTAGTDEGMEVSKKAGADFVFNHFDESYLADMFSVTGAEGFNVILENCADSNLGNDLLMLGHSGRIAVVGTRGPIKPCPRNPKSVEVNPRSLVYTEGKVYGVNLFRITEDEFKNYSNEVIRGMEEGWLRPIIAQEFKLSQAVEAHTKLMSEHARGKLVFNLII